MQRFIPKLETQERTSLSYPTLWRLMKRGDFPASVRIAPNRVAWVEDEVDEWIRARIDGRSVT